MLTLSGLVAGQDDPYAELKQEFIRFVLDRCLLAKVQTINLNNELSLEKEQEIYLALKEDKDRVIEAERLADQMLPLLATMSVQDRMYKYIELTNKCEDREKENQKKLAGFLKRKVIVKEEIRKYGIVECNKFIVKDMESRLDKIEKEDGIAFTKGERSFAIGSQVMTYENEDEYVKVLASAPDFSERKSLYKKTTKKCIDRYKNKDLAIRNIRGRVPESNNEPVKLTKPREGKQGKVDRGWNRLLIQAGLAEEPEEKWYIEDIEANSN